VMFTEQIYDRSTILVGSECLGGAGRWRARRTRRAALR
jgi:hypothetical protein